MTRTLGAVLGLALVLGLVGCDQGTKHLARTTLRGRGAVPLVAGVLDLRYVENPDSAFGLSRVLPEGVRRPVLLLVPALAIPLIVLVWRRRRDARLATAACALLLAGTIGNLVDRAARGGVVDFIHLHHWPVFNVADIALAAGVGLLVLALHPRRRLAS
ncbi:MAG TPA: signal peptidase II [Polyangia bacterium]|jgi:signal peptidase II